jgi:hypothetical protein
MPWVGDIIKQNVRAVAEMADKNLCIWILHKNNNDIFNNTNIPNHQKINFNRRFVFLRFDIPIPYIGVGEGIDDLHAFSAKGFAENLMGTGKGS